LRDQQKRVDLVTVEGDSLVFIDEKLVQSWGVKEFLPSLVRTADSYPHLIAIVSLSDLHLLSFNGMDNQLRFVSKTDLGLTLTPSLQLDIVFSQDFVVVGASDSNSKASVIKQYSLTDLTKLSVANVNLYDFEITYPFKIHS